MTVRNIKTREGYDFWDKLCAIPRHGFIHSPDNSRVLKVEGIGNWIDMHAAQEVVDAAQDEVNGLRAERDQLRAEVEDLKLQVQAARGTSLSSVQVADRLIYERDVLVAERDDARAEVEAMRKAQDARDLEMNAQGIESVIHCVVSKADQAVLRLHAREKRRAALAAKEGM